MPRSLPTNPSLRLVRVQAKELLDDHKSGKTSCCGMLRLLARFAAKSDAEILASHLKLTEVQHALAMDYGFKSWTELKQLVTGASLQEVHKRFWQGVVDEGGKVQDWSAAFMAAASRVPGTPLAGAVEAVGKRVSSGQALWQAIESRASEFTPVICMLCRAAEASERHWPAIAKRISEGVRDGVLGPDAPDVDHEQAAFWRVFGLCLASGVPLLALFDLLKNSYVKSDALKAAVGDMSAEIAAGATLTLAMCKHAALFPPPICAAVLAGESSGTLEKSAMAIGMSLKTGDPRLINACYEAIGSDPGVLIKEHLESVPIMKTVMMLLMKAFGQGASQLELTADDKQAYAFISVSGARVEVEAPVLAQLDKVIARFKTMAKLDCQETMTAQDGRFEMNFKGRVNVMQVRTDPNGGHERLTVKFAVKIDERVAETKALEFDEPDRPVRRWPDLTGFLAGLRTESKDFGELPGYIREIGSPRLYAGLDGTILEASSALLNILHSTRQDVLGVGVSTILSLDGVARAALHPAPCKVLRVSHAGMVEPGKVVYVDMTLRSPVVGSFAARVNIRNAKWKGVPALDYCLEMIAGPSGETGVPWPYPDMEKRTDRAGKIPWDTSEPGQRLKEAGTTFSLATSRDGTILELSIPMLLALNVPESQLVGRSIWEIVRGKDARSIHDFVSARLEDDLHSRPARGIDAEVLVQPDRSFFARLSVSTALWRGQDAVLFLLRPTSETGACSG